ncbi:MAG: dihydroorotase [Spirochaetota bacterium]
MAVSFRAPDDFHVHLRQAPVLAPVVRETSRWCARALVMPNTVPPVTTPEALRRYREEILAQVPSGRSLEPLMTFKVVPSLDPREVSAFTDAGAIGGKLYPQGVTTNSADGVTAVEPLYPIFEAMEGCDLVLEVHAEEPGVFSLDREEAYLPHIERIASRFPRLRVVVEHVSSAAAIEALASLPETVAATVTVHHLLLTLDDVVGDELRPHHFCKPIAKRERDRQAIRDAVFSGDPRVFFGSDSAPHPRDAKEAACGCAGVYTAPVAIPLLAEIFEDAGVPLTEAAAGSTDPRPAAADPRPTPAGEASGDGARLHRPSLESFVSRHGAEFYRLALNDATIRLVDCPWVVPDVCEGVVPFYASERLKYALDDGGNHES